MFRAKALPGDTHVIVEQDVDARYLDKLLILSYFTHESILRGVIRLGRLQSTTATCETNKIRGSFDEFRGGLRSRGLSAR